MKNPSNKIKIKTKETVHDVKTKDSKQNLKYFMKDVAIHEKEKIKDNDNTKSKNDTIQDYAPNRVEEIQKATARQSYRKTKVFIDKRNRKRKQNRNNSNYDLTKDNEILSSIQPKQRNQQILENQKWVSIKQDMKLKTDKHLRFSKIKINQSTPNSYSSTTNNSYSKRMKSFMMVKHKNKVKASKDIVSKPVQCGNIFVRTWKSGAYVITKAVHGISHLWSYGVGLLLLVVITLFIGVFACLSDDGGINSQIEPLSAEVLAYEETITKYAKQFDIEEYVPIIQAIMMQESEGKGNDPMQSSESGFNTKYPRIPNGITNAEYSIEVGIQTFADCLTRAKVDGQSDTEKLYLALQGYNYGSGYIEWAVTNFGGYTKANTKVFSDEMKYKQGTKFYGNPNYVPHVLQYYHSGNIDIVRVAKSQVGNVGGKPYWNWYGFNSRVEWCACFVSWCANETGQLNITIPKFALVEDGIQWFKANGKWGNKNYLPRSGDLIFFDWENDNDSDHVGIVEKVDNNYIYTIEGNSSDECKSKSYSIDSKIIYGYGKNNISKIQRN